MMVQTIQTLTPHRGTKAVPSSGSPKKTKFLTCHGNEHK